MLIGLEKIALRHNALYVPRVRPRREMTAASAEFVANISPGVYTVSEPLLHALNGASGQELNEIRRAVTSIFRTDANWTPLVHDWHTPTGESGLDHIITLWANIFRPKDMPGTRLSCGHFIPEAAFAISRYNGCPFCGRPITFTPGAVSSGATATRTLGLMTDDDMKALLRELLTSTIPPDGTTIDTLRTLLARYGAPTDVIPAIRITAILTAEALEKAGEVTQAYSMLKNPVDLLHYLWYGVTGSIIFRPPSAYRRSRKAIRLHFSRPKARAIANCLEEMDMTPERMAEMMHPHREMWVRIIRAARLTEFARGADYTRLRTLLDIFYRSDYPVEASIVQTLYDHRDPEGVRLLQTQPGRFSRALFSWMLRVGPTTPLLAFAKVARSIKARLLYSLCAYADLYFTPAGKTRTVGGGPGMEPVLIKVNRGLRHYTLEERSEMAAGVKDIFLNEMRRRYAATGTAARVYIAPELFEVPMPVSDRTATVADIQGAALCGQRFKVPGNSVRLFLQWGVGLPAQALDMDLSAAIIYDDHVDECAYYNLTPEGCRHSGDIREIPDQVGTAEYIELNLDTLEKAGARMAVFTCNAFNTSALSPNLVFGWMAAEAPMALDEKTGVAYDPADVQMMMRVADTNLARGLMFGVLDFATREITWLEMPFNGRSLRSLNLAAVKGVLARLRSKPTIGRMLSIRAEATGSTITDTPADATEVYDLAWARRHDLVAQLLLPN